ncbi:starch-binding domain-containing protein 1 [Trachemys scripta elegans]|uniref:starch-binding domain-containing protein 1 n=1 Tax=Trachemys scripta elegans TaxID=31138 RepID=UPI001552D10D|nr:starch-binding domain-containing protein 1 [Trachemys scripta elegans]
MAQGDSPLPAPRLDAASPAQPAGEPLVGLWPALLVGLVAALLAWLWYGRGGEEPPAGPETRGGSSSSGAACQEPPAGAEHCGAAPPATEPLLENSECTLLETTASVLSSPPEPVESLATTPREEHVPSLSDGVSGESPEMELLVKEPTTLLMNYHEYLSNETLGSSTVESALLKGQESETRCGDTLAEASPSSDMHEDKSEEQSGQTLEYQDLVDHEEWEVVPEDSAWGDASKISSADDSDTSIGQGNKELEQVDFLEADSKAKRVAAVPPMPQNIHVNFRVHYITHIDAQLIAVTGDHESLGHWHNYVPLKCDKDGFWSDTVILPADSKIEWKFILVENGKVTRWEECNNRTLMTEHEDRTAHQWWGYH